MPGTARTSSIGKMRWPLLLFAQDIALGKNLQPAQVSSKLHMQRRPTFRTRDFRQYGGISPRLALGSSTTVPHACYSNLCFSYIRVVRPLCSALDYHSFIPNLGSLKFERPSIIICSTAIVTQTTQEDQYPMFPRPPRKLISVRPSYTRPSPGNWHHFMCTRAR